VSATTDPLGDAITVLVNVRIENPSARPDTEDAQNRVALALEYLRLANEIMRSLAKECYVKGVIVKLGDYDHAELHEARKVVDAARDFLTAASENSGLLESVERFDLWERATRFASPCPQTTPHAAHEWQGEEQVLRCPGREGMAEPERPGPHQGGRE
jgi:hypothetical protein